MGIIRFLSISMPVAGMGLSNPRVHQESLALNSR